MCTPCYRTIYIKFKQIEAKELMGRGQPNDSTSGLPSLGQKITSIENTGPLVLDDQPGLRFSLCPSKNSLRILGVAFCR